MEYGLVAIAMIGVLLAHLELTKWKERVRAQQKQIDELCRAIGREALSADTVPDEVREKALRLKRAGREVEAVKVVRQSTGMDLLEAKNWVDGLS